MLKTVTFRSTLIACLCAISVSAYALADAPRKVDVPAGELTVALRSLAEQSGVEFVYSADQLKGVYTGGVHGEYTAEKAVTKLLEGTKLKLTVHESGALLIAPRASSVSPSATSGGVVGVEPLSGGGEGKGEKKRSWWRLAQADTTQNSENPKKPSKSSSAEEDSSMSQDLPAPEETKKAIPEILVSGSRSLNMDIKRDRDNSLPYVIFDREQIEKSGATNVNEFLKYKLPMSSTVFSVSQQAVGRTASKVNLRGLGTNQALILIDGHRTSSISLNGTAAQPDLNGIPLSAIERIEVLPTTASGIYGGSAIGGVINVVLRRDYSGVQTMLGYDGTFDGGGARRHAQMSAGFNVEGGKTNILLAGSYSDSNPLLVQDRNFVQRGRSIIRANDPHGLFVTATPILGSTTNICSADASGFGLCSNWVSEEFGLGSAIPLTLKGGIPLGSSITSVPIGYAGVTSDDGAQIIGNAGLYNLGLATTAQALGGGRTALLNSPRIESLTATVRREFSTRVQGFVEFSASNSAGQFFENQFGYFTLAAADPANPFEQDIVVTTPTSGADGEIKANMQQRRALAGVIVQLPGNWKSELDYTWSRTRSSSSSPPSDMTATVQGLTVYEAVASGALDIFRDTNAFPVDFASYLDSGFRTRNEPAEATLNGATLRVSGPIGWTLPGGPVVLSGLLEHRDEHLGDTLFVNPTFNSSQFFPSRRQTVDSAYLESRLPLVSARNAVFGLRLLELTVAARHDRYETVGASNPSSFGGSPLAEARRATNRFSSTDSTVSLKIQPVSDVTLRASYGTGFLPPAVDQIVPNIRTTILSLPDPRRGNEPLGGGAPITLTSGGNPNLTPEDSETWSAGVVLTPRFAPNLRASADWVHIDKSNNITAAFQPGGGVSIFDYEQSIPGLVTRGPPSGGFEVGPVTALNFGLVNVATQKVDALDLALDYSLNTAGLGKWTFSTVATRQVHNQQQILSVLPVQELAGYLEGGVEWRGNAALDWDVRQWTATWATTYFHSHWINLDHSIDAFRSSATVPSQMYHDLFVRYRLGEMRAIKPFSNTELQIGIQNVFDKSPPLVGPSGNSASYYDYLGDPRMLRYSISITTNF